MKHAKNFWQKITYRINNWTSIIDKQLNTITALERCVESEKELDILLRSETDILKDTISGLNKRIKWLKVALIIVMSISVILCLAIIF